MAIGSAPEIGESFTTVRDFPTFDHLLAYYAKWKQEVGEDLCGGYATLCFPDPSVRSNWVSEFPEGPYEENQHEPYVHRESAADRG